MKTLIAAACLILLCAFTTPFSAETVSDEVKISEASFASFSLVNDTKNKVSIHTGSGFVSLNKGSKTSITCNTGKEVRWAKSGSKKGVIFEITSDMCGKTIKLSDYL